MDAPRGLNEHEADKLLHDLFKEVGQLSAPDGLDARILQRIAVTPRPALASDKPLLPKWTWFAAGVLLTGLAFVPYGGGATSWTSLVPTFEWDRILSSPWLIMGLTTCTALLGLDAWLSKRRLAHQPR